MRERSLWRNFDWPLLAAVLALCGIGIAMIYSATYNTIDLGDYWIRQIVFLGIGIVALAVVSIFDYRQLELLAVPGYIVFIALLVIVALFGTVQGGAKSWLNVGGTVVQPTEAGKFLLIVFFAWYLSWFHDRMGRVQYLLLALVLLGAPLVLVYLQPDFGMTVTYLFIGGTLILVGGIQLWQVAAIAAAGLASIPLIWNSLQGYMLERIQIFLDPGSNPDATYNINQALIAIGNGGWLGTGWTYGSQNQLHFLRVRHTDFIYSVIAEEWGLVGSLIILGLLLFIVWRILRIADLARDQFGRLLAVGVAAIVFFQIVVNVGMNVSIMPVTGLTLPFVSYGGSSLISMLVAIGLAQSVIMRHRKIEFQ
jgi:rod shape determining protein RodA